MILTERQKYILDLICQDYNQKNIATKLKCSLSLVEKEVNYLKVETIGGLVYKYLLF
jgi:DNA-binding CsgD family transcriptional regulator